MGSEAKYYAPNPFYDNFCKIAYQRGMSPFQLCMSCGFTNGAYTRWANGMPPSDNSVHKLAERLGVDASELTETKRTRAEKKEKNSEMISAMTLYCRTHNISYGQLQYQMSSGKISKDDLQAMLVTFRAKRDADKEAEEKRTSTFICPVCGKVFPRAWDSRQYYCSKECYMSAQRKVENARRYRWYRAISKQKAQERMNAENSRKDDADEPI